MQVTLKADWNSYKKSETIDVNGSIAHSLVEKGLAEFPGEKKEVTHVKEKNEHTGPVSKKKK